MGQPMNDADGKYALKYDFKHECGQFDAQEGTADAMVLLSVVYHDDGGMDVLQMSVDGRTGESMSKSDVMEVLRLATVGESSGRQRPHTRPKRQYKYDKTAENIERTVVAD